MPEKAISRRGDLWKLGRHRLLCGDATSTRDVERLLEGHNVDVAWSDIPYGIDYSSGREQIVRHKAYGKIEGDRNPNIGRYAEAVLSLKAQDEWVCCSPVNMGPALAAFDRRGGVNAIVVWKKPAPGLGYQWIRRYCEFLLFSTQRSKPKNELSEFDCWEIGTDPKQEYQHGTQKPVALVKRSLQFSPGKVVVDLFLGSGTTLIACEQLGRVCRAIEIEPLYVDVAVQRWCEFTGKDAVRENDGKKWSALVKIRNRKSGRKET